MKATKKWNDDCSFSWCHSSWVHGHVDWTCQCLLRDTIHNIDFIDGFNRFCGKLICTWIHIITRHYILMQSLYMIFFDLWTLQYNVPWRPGDALVDAIIRVSYNVSYKTHQIPKLKCFSSRLAVVFAQYIKARCFVENKYVVGAAPTGAVYEWCSPKYIRSIIFLQSYSTYKICTRFKSVVL